MSSVGLDLEQRITSQVSGQSAVVPKPRSKLWSRSVMTVLSLALYAGIESVISATNLIPWLQIKKNEARFREEYAGKHHVWFEGFTPDHDLGFTLTPGIKKSPFLFDTDGYGFQEGEVDKDSRVVAVGDSFCYGFYVQHGEVWTRVAERVLSTPVTNLGVIGYAPWQLNRLLNHEPRQGMFDRKVIVYTIYANDFPPETPEVAPNYYRRHGWDKFRKPDPDMVDLIGAFYPEEGVFDKTATEHRGTGFFGKTVTAMAYDAITQPKHSVVVKDIHGNYVNLFYSQNELLPEHTTPESKAVVGTLFNEAITIARDKGSILLPVLIPSKTWFYRREFAEAYDTAQPVLLEEDLLNWANEYFTSQGVKVVDLRYPLTQASEQVSSKPYLSDGHFSRFGNYVMGLAVARHIQQYHSEFLKTQPLPLAQTTSVK